MSRQTIMRISLAAIRSNLSRIRQMAPNSQVACVVKADAYGHGIKNLMPALNDADILAVATIEEAQQCRDLGWHERLVLLEGPANESECSKAQELACELVIHHESQLGLIKELSNPQACPLWLKLDTGMHRLGFDGSRARELFDHLKTITGSAPQVLMSHFACADDRDHPKTIQQIQRFDSAIEGLSGQVSLANSGGIINFPQSHREIIRPGLMLYGVSPIAGQSAGSIGLKPVMTLQCALIAINKVKAGESVGYHGTQVCPRDMTIGIAAIGYGDGYPQRLKAGTPVLVNGRRASLFGPVSMDMITIDLHDHPDAGVGDTVTLWGDGLPVEEIAPYADAIPWELICGVTARVRSVLEK